MGQEATDASRPVVDAVAMGLSNALVVDILDRRSKIGVLSTADPPAATN